jgi:hypothetical protein
LRALNLSHNSIFKEHSPAFASLKILYPLNLFDFLFFFAFLPALLGDKNLPLVIFFFDQLFYRQKAQ